MADIIQDVILRVSSDAENLRKGVGQVDDKVKETKKSASGLQNSFKSLLPALGVAAIVAGFKKIAIASIQAADVQLKAEAKVQQAIKSTQGVAGRTLDQLKQQAQDLQKTTLFGDEEILKGATATLLTFTKISGEQFDEAQKVVLDLSTAMGTDLQSASLQVGKALNDPILGVTALARSGIQFTQQQKDVIKSLAETGQIAEAQKIILQELNTQFGGQAEAAAKVGLGAWGQFKNMMSDVGEEVGFLLLDGLNPLFELMKTGATYLGTFVAQLRGAEEATGSWGKVIEAIRQPFLDLVEYTKDFYTAVSNVYGILGDLIERTGLAGEKFSILSTTMSISTAPFRALITVATGFLAVINGVAKSIDTLVSNFNTIKTAFKDFDITKPFESLREITIEIGEVGGGIATAFKDGFDEIFADDTITEKIKENVQTAGEEGGEDLVDGFVEGAEKAAKEVDTDGIAKDIQKALLESFKNNPLTDEEVLTMLGLSPEQIAGVKLAEVEVQLGLDTEESIDAINDWIEENQEAINEIDFTGVYGADKFEIIGQNMIEVFSMANDAINALPIGEKAQKEIERLDELIEKQKEAVDKAKTYAEEGNSEQLALEETRLANLENLQKQEQQQKEQALKRSLAIQKSMALAEIAINLATTLSNIDKTSAALGPLGVPLKTTQTLQAIAQAAINTAAVLSANASFYEGTEDTGRGGKLDSRGGFAAVLHPNERVMTAQQNKRIKQALGNVSNDDLVKMIENSKSLSVNPGGLLVDSSAINEKMNTKMDEMISLNREMLKAMKRNGVNVNIDRNGLSVMMHQMVQRQNILNSL